TMPELMRMFELADYLQESLGITHANLKPDKFLHRINGEGKEEIVLNNFGSAGQWSAHQSRGKFRPRMSRWSQDPMGPLGCQAEKLSFYLTDEELKDRDFVEGFNRFQLLSALTLFKTTYVLDWPERGDVAVLDGILEKPFQKYC